MPSQHIRVEERPDRTIFFFQVRALNHDTTRDLVPALAGVALEGCRAGIELRPLEFVCPFGLVYLYWYVRWLLDTMGARHVDIVLDGAKRDLCNYLKRMRLPDVLGSRVTIYPIQELELRERDLTDSLLELNAFRIDDDNEVELRASQTLHVILAQRPDLESRREHLHLAISELLSNIEVHSHTREAALAVQTYQDRIELAFGDGGRGIPAALGTRLGSGLTDLEFIRRALEPGISSRPGGGGYGLTQLLEAAQEEGGRLTIRSGRGQLSVGPQGEEAHGSCTPIPGTIVEVVFPIS